MLKAPTLAYYLNLRLTLSLNKYGTQILNMKNKTENVNNNLTKSNNILNRMKKTYEQNKCMSILVIIIAIIIITIIVILVVTK